MIHCSVMSVMKTQLFILNDMHQHLEDLAHIGCFSNNDNELLYGLTH